MQPMEFESERLYSSAVVGESENDVSEQNIVYPQQHANIGESADCMAIDELQNQGIGMADIQKLKLAGICTIKVHEYFCVCALTHTY